MYSGDRVWLTGHSLGGGLASLISLKTGRIPYFSRIYSRLGYPALAFNSPGEAYYAWLMDLDSTNDHAITHIWNDCDPIPSGECYACEFKASISTRCHLGQTCVFPAFCWFSRITYH